jgi:hypothetical protein
MTDELIDLLQSIDPLREQELEDVLERGRMCGGAQRISATPWRRPRRAGRRTVGLACASTVAAVGAAAVLLSLSSSSTPNAEALSFSQQGDYVVARIVNPYASVSELKRELAANHLHVALKLVPASPGSVGKVVMIDVNGSPQSGIQPLLEGQCANGPCTVGVKVARDYKGTGYVVIGRPAKPGERYQSTPIGGSFARGEALHCSGLEGAPLRQAIPMLRSKGLSVVRWRMVSGAGGSLRSAIAKLTLRTGRQAGALESVLARLDRRGHPAVRLRELARVQEIAPVAPGEVEVWVTAAPHRSASIPHSARRPHAPGVAEAPAMLKHIRPFLRESCRAREAIARAEAHEHAQSRPPAG